MLRITRAAYLETLRRQITSHFERLENSFWMILQCQPLPKPAIHRDFRRRSAASPKQTLIPNLETASERTLPQIRLRMEL